MLQSTFGPYRIEELLGRGGMGEVYRAHDTETDRRVALKVLPAHLAEDAEYQERFRRECRSAARLREPHVVPIHRFGEIDGRLYLDMRLVEGTDLASWLKSYGPMPPEAAVSVISQIAAALDAAHAEGMVHRDVKPSNVLLAGVTDGNVDANVFAYLFDFGIARAQDGVGDDPALTRAGTMPGSLAYIAPERFSGVEGDPRADVYSLACVLHQALTGRPPFEGDMATLMNAHLNAAPPRPSTTVPALPSGLDQVVAQGMAKDPAARTPTAGALAAAARAEIGVWRTDPSSSAATAAWGGAAAAAPGIDLSKQQGQGQPGPAQPPPGTAVIPPAWGPSQPAAGAGWGGQQSWDPNQQAWGGQQQQGAWAGGATSNPSNPAYPSNPSYPSNPAYAAGQGYPSNPAYPTGQPYPPGPTYPSNPAGPGYGQPPPKRNRTGLIIVAVIAAIAVIGSAVLIAVTLNNNGNTIAGPGTTTTTTAAPPTTTAPPATTTTTPPTPTGTAAGPEVDRLLADLPTGYDVSNCTPSSEVFGGSIAFVRCDAPPSTGFGPTGATFTRYATEAELDAQFDVDATNDGNLPALGGAEADCSTSTGARLTYSRGSNPGGFIACFTNSEGAAFLIWTDPDALGLGYIVNSDGDAASLYSWWQGNDFYAVR